MSQLPTQKVAATCSKCGHTFDGTPSREARRRLREKRAAGGDEPLEFLAEDRPAKCCPTCALTAMFASDMPLVDP